MDEAAVSTIHGWCNRMLREHAFDSGSLFNQALEADQRELLADVLRDYWRSFCIPLQAESARTMHDWWGTPEALQADVAPLLACTDALGAGEAPAVALREAREESQRLLAAIKAPWERWADELEALLDKACAAKLVHGQRLQSRFYRSWLECLRAWATGDAIEPLQGQQHGLDPPDPCRPGRGVEGRPSSRSSGAR